jgi:hypothetical protein
MRTANRRAAFGHRERIVPRACDPKVATGRLLTRIVLADRPNTRARSSTLVARGWRDPATVAGRSVNAVSQVNEANLCSFATELGSTSERSPRRNAVLGPRQRHSARGAFARAPVDDAIAPANGLRRAPRGNGAARARDAVAPARPRFVVVRPVEPRRTCTRNGTFWVRPGFCRVGGPTFWRVGGHALDVGLFRLSACTTSDEDLETRRNDENPCHQQLPLHGEHSASAVPTIDPR